jgi:hypothetical protein
VFGTFVPGRIPVELTGLSSETCRVRSSSRLPLVLEGIVTFVVSEMLTVSVRVQIASGRRRVQGGGRWHETELRPLEDPEARDAFALLHRVTREGPGPRAS